jgi:hypothetical protein
MKEPGLDGRHRDKAAPKKGEIQQKRGDTLNRNLPQPIPQFRGDTKLETMRKVECGRRQVSSSPEPYHGALWLWGATNFAHASARLGVGG